MLARGWRVFDVLTTSSQTWVERCRTTRDYGRNDRQLIAMPSHGTRNWLLDDYSFSSGFNWAITASSIAWGAQGFWLTHDEHAGQAEPAGVVFSQVSYVSYFKMLARSPIDVGSPQLFITMAIIVLCACVLMQMLGVSATLWNPSAMPDTLGSSLFIEGFSIPTSVPAVFQGFIALLPESLRQSPHVPLLSHALFHPPVDSL